MENEANVKGTTDSTAIESKEKTQRPVLHGKMKEDAERKLINLINENNLNVNEIKKLINDGVDINCGKDGQRHQTPLYMLAHSSFS